MLHSTSSSRVKACITCGLCHRHMWLPTCCSTEYWHCNTCINSLCRRAAQQRSSQWLCRCLRLTCLQVFVHALRQVDMRATVGQQSSTTLAISGGSSDRLVAAYSSQPGELQATPGSLSLPAGGIAALGLVFKPRSWGHQRVRLICCYAEWPI
jgi:hypothetical protein